MTVVGRECLGSQAHKGARRAQGLGQFADGGLQHGVHLGLTTDAIGDLAGQGFAARAALRLLKQAGAFQGLPQLVGDRLNQCDLVVVPNAVALDLLQIQNADNLAADLDGRGQRGAAGWGR